MIYGYARVSTVEQSLEYDALKQQVKRLEDAGADEVLVDIESGRSNKRKEFNKLLKLIEKGKVREVLVTRVDRLGRSDINVLRTLQFFDDSGIKLRILDAPIDISSSFGRFSASQMAALADFESRLLSERTRHGMAYFRSQGKVQSACFGYKLNKEHKIIPDEKTFPVARKVIELLLDGYSYGAVSRYLFEEHEIKYSVSAIRHLLDNPTILGHTRYFTDMEQRRNPKNPRPPQIIKNTHKAIATEFEVARIKRNAKSRPRFTGNKEKEYPLKGLLKCAHCEGGMFRLISRYKSGETHWIRCNKHARNPHLCHNKKNSRLSVLTEQVILAITEEAERIIEQSELADNPVESSELIDLKQQLEGLKALNSSNPAIIAAMQDIENQIEAEVIRSQYADKIDADRLKLAWSYSQPAFWESLEDDDLRQVFKSFIEAVFVDSTGNVSSVSFDE